MHQVENRAVRKRQLQRVIEYAEKEQPARGSERQCNGPFFPRAKFQVKEGSNSGGRDKAQYPNGQEKAHDPTADVSRSLPGDDGIDLRFTPQSRFFHFNFASCLKSVLKKYIGSEHKTR